MSKNYLKISLALLVCFGAVAVSFAAPKTKINAKKPSPALSSALLMDQATIEAIQEVRESLVSIVVKEKVLAAGTTIVFVDPKTGKTRTVEEPGKQIFQEAARASGVIVDERGFILTNKHVVNFKDALIRVYLANGDIVDGYIVDLDPANDLAIIKINGGKYRAAKLGDSDLAQIGQTILAIGYSLGKLENTVTRGIVSGLGRVVTADVPGGGNTETISDTIQTDASINRGNSGGPLINLRGEVLGINTAIEQIAQGISYTIPINLAKLAIKTAIHDGKIKRARLGVRYVMITPEIKDARALQVKNGALLVQGADESPAVISGGPGERAGLRAHDIITDVGGVPLTLVNSLQNMISRFEPGKTITIGILREGAKLKIPVILDEFPH